MAEPEAFIRTYNATTDYAAVAYNLREAEMFDPDRDTEDLLSQHASSVLVAEADAMVVGSIYVSKAIMPIVYRLAVRQAYRGRGIGSLLLRAAEDQLRQQGHPDIGLFVDANDEEVQGFYASRGYEAGGTYRSMWRRI